MTAHYVVVGDPIAHSLSPQIHQQFADQLGISLDYRKAHVREDEFADFFSHFWSSGGAGANVTVPLKELAFAHANHLDHAAQRAGAVNTLARRADGIHGFNTDGGGLCRDLVERYQVDLQGVTVLLLGAGGAARGVIQPLLDRGCARIVVVNRTAARARTLADRFAGEPVSGCGFAELQTHLQGADLIINATSAALTGGAAYAGPELPVEWLTDAVCYDMSYGENAHFCRWATSLQARLSLDGLGMLVEQAALAFGIWHGESPATQPVLEQLRADVVKTPPA